MGGDTKAMKKFISSSSDFIPCTWSKSRVLRKRSGSSVEYTEAILAVSITEPPPSATSPSMPSLEFRWSFIHAMAFRMESRVGSTATSSKQTASTFSLANASMTVWKEGVCLSCLSVKTATLWQPKPAISWPTSLVQPIKKAGKEDIAF